MKHLAIFVNVIDVLPLDSVPNEVPRLTKRLVNHADKVEAFRRLNFDLLYIKFQLGQAIGLLYEFKLVNSQGPVLPEGFDLGCSRTLW